MRALIKASEDESPSVAVAACDGILSQENSNERPCSIPFLNLVVAVQSIERVTSRLYVCRRGRGSGKINHRGSQNWMGTIAMPNLSLITN